MLIRDILTPDIAITWSPWAVQYLFFAGLVIGASWIATFDIWLARKGHSRVEVLAGLVILGSIIVAPFSLLGDLHQPARAWHFYAQVRPDSWMWLGACLLPFFIGFNLLFGYLLVRQRLPKDGVGLWAKIGRFLRLGSWDGMRALKLVGILASLSSFSIAFYSGFEIGSVRAVPLWHTYYLPFLFGTTAFASGAGFLLFLHRVIYGEEAVEEAVTRRLKGWLQIVVLSIFIAFALWWMSGDMAVQQWQTVMGENSAWVERAFALFALWALSLVLVFWPRSNLAMLALSGALITLMSWGYHWVLLLDGQTIPKYGAAVHLYSPPWGPDGILGLAASFGLWLALMVAFSEWVRLGLNDQPEMRHGY